MDNSVNVGAGTSRDVSVGNVNFNLPDHVSVQEYMKRKIFLRKFLLRKASGVGRYSAEILLHYNAVILE